MPTPPHPIELAAADLARRRAVSWSYEFTLDEWDVQRPVLDQAGARYLVLPCFGPAFEVLGVVVFADTKIGDVAADAWRHDQAGEAMAHCAAKMLRGVIDSCPAWSPAAAENKPLPGPQSRIVP